MCACFAVYTSVALPPSGLRALTEYSRMMVEESFMAGVRGPASPRDSLPPYDPDALEPYGDSMYVLPSGSYLSDEITCNIYLESDSATCPAWSADAPLESIANLMVSRATGSGDVTIELSVLRHEYGRKDTFPTTVGQLLSYCLEDGCQPYWGVESYDGDTLRGTLFLHNPHMGYDHVLRVECKPSEVISGTGSLRARASLYIPIYNLLD